MIVVGLLALSSVAAIAASVKTSKAVALNDTQMASVKGQAVLRVFLWVGNNYTVVQTCYIGEGVTDAWQYTGGPLDGQYGGCVPIPH